ncbi:hypothetical protein TraAM80_02664 [Trypanosoma rangeli]|uniref:Uncharacterized protein n=1 Tax=Trypanosoma rangeli TaxID=5698 RepID=A0A422NT47_TRYRA|nr:uncharacterized protein TraAM80_02664 [Trypanosoma rangeli]RNF08638.1 hypothetical protein TraAM80_02664 [Trypanosoma rangeli]|eukprot:RNF08638.1 hypothetical protein TraAM80_02664 [Trypanosoma rangeli]
MCDMEPHRGAKVPSSRRLQAVTTPELLRRVRDNDPTLGAVRISPELLNSPIMMDALLRNNTICSVTFVNVSPKTVSEATWAKFLSCLFHLPLRSVIAGGMQLPAHFMRHVLELVEYSCGVGRGCKWLPEDSNTLDVKAAVSAADETVGEAASSSTDDLKANAALEFFDLSGSYITESHARWLARTLFHLRSSLRHVDLSECRLGTLGLQMLLLEESSSNSRLTAEVAAVTKLEILDLRWNGVTEDFGFRLFLDSLEMHSKCITCVLADGNYISSALHQRLVDRKTRMWSLITDRRQTRYAEAKELKQAQQREQQAASSWFFLDLLFSVAAESSLSFPSLSLLASLLLTRE